MKRYIVFLLVILSGCTSHIKNEALFEDGVSSSLAGYRYDVINNLSYSLSFNIPENKERPIDCRESAGFTLASVRKPLLLDFRAPSGYIKEVSVNGQKINIHVKNSHIIIAPEFLKKGENSVTINFRAGDMSLNRNDDYLYTLFVPDRASTVFPCFDQPDLKAFFNLTLDIPSEWEAIANNNVIKEDTVAGRKIITYGKGEKISTYLFAFAAGRFKRIEKEIGGIKMEMLHRETREEYVKNNIDEIFQLHYKAIRWLEEYTGIKYPFPKFGFVLIPSFQYSGMEHPGSICYNSSSLFLDKSPTLNEQLSRASLIAHETSHIWFGDLVTMKWFDDVWLKEVFAGFFADKIVSPSFPSINNDLRFLFTHFPAAYKTDRSKGSNPIIQNLENLKNAGSLYGPVIYDKAPAVMRQLEEITGESNLRSSLRTYLKRFSYDNAEWNDLINIIEEKSSIPLKKWSDTWVRESGMPVIKTQIRGQEGSYRVSFGEADPDNKNRHWPQTLKTRVITESGPVEGSCTAGDPESYITTKDKPLCIVPDTTGKAYGCFIYDSLSLTFFEKHIASFKDPLLRGIIWINLNEDLHKGKIESETLFIMTLNAIREEKDQQIQTYLAGRLSAIFWNNFDSSLRNRYGKEAENLALSKLNEADNPSTARVWFNLFRNVSLTGNALNQLYQIWDSGSLPGNIRLSEDELSTIAFNLALRGCKEADSVITRQYRRISNQDSRKRFSFIIPALSKEQSVRDAFFESLKKPENREHEPWVIEALGYLHHPLRAGSSEKYILPSLEMLEEIKATGDIFFPGNWITITLSGHHSESAKKTVDNFLKSNPDYPHDLRLKILQAEDQM